MLASAPTDHCVRARCRDRRRGAVRPQPCRARSLVRSEGVRRDEELLARQHDPSLGVRGVEPRCSAAGAEARRRGGCSAGRRGVAQAAAVAAAVMLFSASPVQAANREPAPKGPTAGLKPLWSQFPLDQATQLSKAITTTTPAAATPTTTTTESAGTLAECRRPHGAAAGSGILHDAVPCALRRRIAHPRTPWTAPHPSGRPSTRPTRSVTRSRIVNALSDPTTRRCSPPTAVVRARGAR